MSAPANARFTIGLDGISTDEALGRLSDMTEKVVPISKAEYLQRIDKAQQLMQVAGVGAILLHSGTNLQYFTGLKWSPSERLVAAILPAAGDLCYIAPRFEIDTINDFMVLEAPVQTWEEHESPYALVCKVLEEKNAIDRPLAVDPTLPFFMATGLTAAGKDRLTLEDGTGITQGCRQDKSAMEIQLIRRAHKMTLTVIQAAASILRPGISTVEVADFIDKAHRKVGAPEGSHFCIVLFGVATSFPHGVKDPQTLKENDWVLIDTGFRLNGYHSDITRSFCFGTPTQEQKDAWNSEKKAQLAAFEAAKPGMPCEVVDAAARKSLQDDGYGPGYQLPGLPHRTGHGCGLDIHEGPFVVKGEATPLGPNMVFSIEPMLVIPGGFGVRLEDHFYMAPSGPVWFTQPAASLKDPFDIMA